MKNINKKYPAIFAILFAVIIILVFGIFILLNEMIKISSNFIEEKRELEYLVHKSNSLDQIDNLDEIESKITEAESLFINPQKPIDIVLFLKEVADENNISISIDLIQSHDLGNEIWPFLSFKINANGSFLDFYQFLKEVELRKWMTSVYHLKIEKNEKDNNLETGEEIKSEIILRVYYLN